MKSICVILTILATLCSMPMAAQTPAKTPTCKVVGVVADKETDEPEPMVTVCVSHKGLPGGGTRKVLADSAGRFEVVLPILPGAYGITAAMIGRVAVPRQFTLAEGDTLKNIGRLYMTDDVKMLKEVTVDAQKPLVTMDVDKLTYDVAADPDAKTLRLSELMGKVPLISVDGEGNIEMNGTKKFLILQNGRKTAITRNPKAVLSSLPAEMVKSIEVITSPGAKYDAEGIGGIINIVMRSQYEGHLTRLFADAGTLVNAGGNYVNAYTGETTAFPEGGGMTASMKTFYDTELLENARPELIHTQFARKQVLPAGRGKTVEWRKWNTLEDAGALTEGVIPTGQKFGQSAVTQAVTQYGTYVSVSDQLELHAIDDVILGAAEELGASAGTTQDKLVRNVVVAGTNVQYCDKVGTNGAHTAVTSRAGLDTTAKLTPDEVNKAVTLLKKLKAPKIDGKYVAIIHPSVAYDLRSSDAWVEAHKYAGITELFTGEIGELHGVRFIETTEAKVFNGEGCPVKTAADESNGTPAEYYSVYATLFLGKDAYGMIDPEGGNMEMIIKDKGQVGGPLNQFSTLGYKFSSAAKILCQDRMVRVESCGAYSAEDEAN